MLKRVMVGATIAGASWAVYARMRRTWATWGIDPGETAMRLRGDELVAGPTTADTRGITIDAPPSAVWPWLVQLGYGRGGWYSYDRMDMRGRSATTILPELQSLAVGDMVPTDPRGGFEVKVLEPERALVLLVDQEIAARRTAAKAGDAVPAGLQASGRFMEASMPPEFAVSWAIVLQPLEGGRTRLIERVRARFATTTPGTRVLGPMLGFGVFVMTRRQMLGLKARAEAAAATTSPATAPVAEPAPLEATVSRPPRVARRASEADDGAADIAEAVKVPTPHGNGHASDLADAAPAS